MNACTYKKSHPMTMANVTLNCMLMSLTTYAQDINFEARIDKSRMSYQDVLVLTLVLSGGNVDMDVTVLHRLVASAVGSQDTEAFHLPF